jgi:hypothetical protein
VGFQTQLLLALEALGLLRIQMQLLEVHLLLLVYPLLAEVMADEVALREHLVVLVVAAVTL